MSDDQSCQAGAWHEDTFAGVVNLLLASTLAGACCLGGLKPLLANEAGWQVAVCLGKNFFSCVTWVDVQLETYTLPVVDVENCIIGDFDATAGMAAKGLSCAFAALPKQLHP
jgi:hypothetical protein